MHPVGTSIVPIWASSLPKRLTTPCNWTLAQRLGKEYRGYTLMQCILPLPLCNRLRSTAGECTAVNYCDSPLQPTEAVFLLSCNAEFQGPNTHCGLQTQDLWFLQGVWRPLLMWMWGSGMLQHDHCRKQKTADTAIQLVVGILKAQSLTSQPTKQAVNTLTSSWTTCLYAS